MFTHVLPVVRSQQVGLFARGFGGYVGGGFLASVRNLGEPALSYVRGNGAALLRT